MTRSQTIIAADADELAWKASELFKAAARACAEREGRFVVALSGGSTPRGLHRLLARPPALTEIPWQHTHLFWVDERCVPVSAPESNLGLAWKDLLGHIPLPRDHIHGVRGELASEQAAAQYHRELVRFFGLAAGELPIFDLVMLGVGTDGHTASLFPGMSTRHPANRLAVAVRGGTPALDRVTLTLPVLNRARQIVFLVAGREKAEMVQTLARGTRQDLPAAWIKPTLGEVIWLLDREAASLLAPPRLRWRW
jgi:6-phosphogluconolactonase